MTTSSITMKVSAETQQAVMKTEALNKKLKASNKILAKSVELSQKEAREQRKATQASRAGTSGMLAKATAISGVTAAVGLLIKAFSNLRSEEVAGAQAAKGQLDVIKTLNQVATSGKDLRFLQKTAADIGTTTSVGSIGKARALVSRGRSLTDISDKEFPLLKDLADIEADPTGLISVVDTAIKTLGRKETGAARQVANKLISAGDISPFSASKLAVGFGPATEGLKAAGLGDEAILGGLAIGASLFQTPEKAGTKLRSLGAIGSRAGIKDAGSIRELVTRIEEDPKALKSVRAEKETSGAFDQIKANLSAMEDATKKINLENQRFGTGFSAISRAKNRLAQDPTARVGRNEAMRNVQEELRLERQGVRGEQTSQGLQTIRNQSQNLSEKGPLSAVVGQVDIGVATFASWMPQAISEAVIAGIIELRRKDGMGVGEAVGVLTTGGSNTELRRTETGDTPFSELPFMQVRRMMREPVE